MTLKEQIAAANTRKIVPVKIPEWGATVYVRTLTGAERDLMEFGFIAAKEAGTLERTSRAIVVAAYACDETGAAIWQQSEIAAIADLQVSALERIRMKGDRLNRISTADEEELEKK